MFYMLSLVTSSWAAVAAEAETGKQPSWCLLRWWRGFVAHSVPCGHFKAVRCGFQGSNQTQEAQVCWVGGQVRRDLHRKSTTATRNKSTGIISEEIYGVYF